MTNDQYSKKYKDQILARFNEATPNKEQLENYLCWGAISFFAIISLICWLSQ